MKYLCLLVMLGGCFGVSAQLQSWQDQPVRQAELKPLALLEFKDGHRIEFDYDPSTHEVTVAEQGLYGPLFSEDEALETPLQLFLKSTPVEVPVPHQLIVDHLAVADHTPLDYANYPNTEQLARQVEQRHVSAEVVRVSALPVPMEAYSNQLRAGSWCGGAYDSDHDPGSSSLWHIRFRLSPHQDWGHLFRTKSKRRAAKSEINTCWLPPGSSMTVKVGYHSSLGGYVMQKDVNIKANAWGRVRVWNRAKRTRISLLDRHCHVTSAYACDGSLRVNYLWKGRLKSGWGKP